MIYVSLSTIPQRLKNLNKSVESLLKQTRKPDKIFINIPFKYKRFSETIEDSQIPKFNTSDVEVTRCEDCGPGTKLLGSLNKWSTPAPSEKITFKFLRTLQRPIKAVSLIFFARETPSEINRSPPQALTRVSLSIFFSSLTKLAACISPEGSPVTIYNFN